MLNANDRNAAPHVWGGIECTVNRIHDDYRDQIVYSGHHGRPYDLERFAELGLKTLRYPVLWERVAPDEGGPLWAWSDRRLAMMRDLNIEPIVGLLHHGSGPRYTSLVDPAFPLKFAQYARAVAERYPHARLYTPINEPLTTARFSGLYGWWYPHGADPFAFATMIVNQCRATVLAMNEIRRVRPDALLIQTDDLGKVYSTKRLAYQAQFENDRRWLAFDLLCGRVDRHHPMWRYLTFAGIPERDLEWFLDQSFAPDIIGVNHYLTSERYLDHRIEQYPEQCVGSNGRHIYADVEAVRVLRRGLAGPKRLLREAWDRYRIPIAVTEVHLCCTEDDQMRWFHEVWSAAQALHHQGVDVIAVTAWALLGAFDWDSLLTRTAYSYESGVFDVSSGEPQPTALADMVRALATIGGYKHAWLDEPGWWRRDERLLYPEREPIAF